MSSSFFMSASSGRGLGVFQGGEFGGEAGRVVERGRLAICGDGFGFGLRIVEAVYAQAGEGGAAGKRRQRSDLEVSAYHGGRYGDVSSDCGPERTATGVAAPFHARDDLL